MENDPFLDFIQYMQSTLVSIQSLTELSQSSIEDKNFSDFLYEKIAREIGKSNQFLKDFLEHIKKVTPYDWFFGFSGRPFEVTPDPKFFHLPPEHQKLLVSILDGIKKREGIISLTGETGTGKTSLIHAALNKIDKNVKPVFIFHPPATFLELLKNILRELDIKIQAEGERSLFYRLEEYLDNLSGNETVVVIVDEAQNLRKGVIAKVEKLSDLKKQFQVILVGQPEFASKIRSKSLRLTKGKRTANYQIKPLTREQSEQYIAHRLEQVGSSASEIFTSKAVSLIAGYSQGIPRTINILCDNALQIGYGLSKRKIDEEIILKAKKSINGHRSSFPARIVTVLKKLL